MSIAGRAVRSIMSDIRRVAIIGGGPSSIAAAKHLWAEKHFTTIDIFEQRSRAGGVWDYFASDKLGLSGTFDCPIPHTTPDDATIDTPLRRDSGYGDIRDDRLVYLSPLYDRLEANLPKMLMQHSDLEFADDVQLFPTHQDIAEYLERYAKTDMHTSIQWETQVTHASPYKVNGATKWKVTTRKVARNTSSTADYDAVIVASGHYNVPFIPEMPNISEWNDKYPGVISHSKFFKNPEELSGKKVLTIGIGPSGQDIATQISQYASQLFVSTRSPPSSPSFIPPRAAHLPGISAFLTSPSDPDRAVRFVDGRVESDFDAILFCTGYMYSYPFLPPTITDPAHAEYPLLKTNGARVHNIYKHLFYSPDPTLAFLILPWKIIPFPLAESQGAVVARVWSGRLKLPDLKEMLEWEERGEEAWGKGKEFHRMAPPMDVEYINELYRWANEVEDGGVGVGKDPPCWDEKIRWMRMNVKNFKEKFFGLGEARRNVRTLEELGFEFNGDGKVKN